MKKILLATALATLLSPPVHAGALAFTHLWTYHHDSSGVAGLTSEIPAFDPVTKTLWVAGVKGVDILDMSGARVGYIDTTPFGSINSVAIYNGVAALAIEDGAERTLPGVVKFYDTTTRALSAGINSVTVGALPDMLTFSRDGSRLLVANEGTPTTYGGYDPLGSVSIIDMASRSLIATPEFAAVPAFGSYLRTGTGMDFEPEYIAVDASGTKAFVTLQEANGIGVIDLVSNAATQVIGLGVKDFSVPGNEIDPNHKDGKIELRAAAVRGLYQPDGIAAYQAGGRTYLVMANEGDTREDDGDKERVKNAGLSGYPADLKELNISTPDTTSGTDLVTFGGRSFSIRDEAGSLVFDSGNDLEELAIAAGIYDDNRSDDKGVEPEGVTLMELAGRILAFIGLERTSTGAVAVYDVTDPFAPNLIDFLVTAGDVSPEGLHAFTWHDQAYLAIANEVSNTTTLYAINAVPEPQIWALLLTGLSLIGAVARQGRNGG